jgi:hypothetical protein
MRFRSHILIGTCVIICLFLCYWLIQYAAFYLIEERQHVSLYETSVIVLHILAVCSIAVGAFAFVTRRELFLRLLAGHRTAIAVTVTFFVIVPTAFVGVFVTTLAGYWSACGDTHASWAFGFAFGAFMRWVPFSLPCLVCFCCASSILQVLRNRIGFSRWIPVMVVFPFFFVVCFPYTASRLEFAVIIPTAFSIYWGIYSRSELTRQPLGRWLLKWGSACLLAMMILSLAGFGWSYRRARVAADACVASAADGPYQFVTSRLVVLMEGGDGILGLLEPSWVLRYDNPVIDAYTRVYVNLTGTDAYVPWGLSPVPMFGMLPPSRWYGPGGTREKATKRE